MATSHEPLKGGYDVDENAVALLQLLPRAARAGAPLVRLAAARAPAGGQVRARRPPARRRARADQDQAPPVRAAHAERLPRRPLARAGRAAGPRERRAASSAEYLEIAYGELKPALAAAMRIHLANLDPVIDEPSLRLLTQLLHRQERHVVELPRRRSRTRSRSRTSARCRSACARCASCGSWRRSTSPRATTTCRSPRRATPTSPTSCTSTARRTTSPPTPTSSATSSTG